MPAEVDAIYDETMIRINGQVKGDMHLAKKVLSWITYAHRPLSLEELRHALAVSPGMTKMDTDDLVDESILTSVCAGLVVVEKQSTTVRLVRAYSNFQSNTCFAYSCQTTQRRSILNTQERLYFHVLKPI